MPRRNNFILDDFEDIPKPFTIPSCLHVLLQYGDGAWLVGGAANPYTNKEPRDYDILVPWDHWKYIAPLIPKDATINNLGGFKFTIKVEGVEKSVDIWPGNLSDVALHPKLEWMYHMKTDVFFRKENYRPPRCEVYS